MCDEKKDPSSSDRHHKESCRHESLIAIFVILLDLFFIVHIIHYFYSVLQQWLLLGFF